MVLPLNFFQIYKIITFTLIFLELYKDLHKTEEHRDIANTISNMADEHSNLGKHREALEMYDKVLSKFLRKG